MFVKRESDFTKEPSLLPEMKLLLSTCRQYDVDVLKRKGDFEPTEKEAQTFCKLVNGSGLYWVTMWLAKLLETDEGARRRLHLYMEDSLLCFYHAIPKEWRQPDTDRKVSIDPSLLPLLKYQLLRCLPMGSLPKGSPGMFYLVDSLVETLMRQLDAGEPLFIDGGAVSTLNGNILFTLDEPFSAPLAQASSSE